MGRILNVNTPLGETETVLMTLSGSEALGRLPRYQLRLASKRGKIKPAELLGKNITAGVELPGGGPPRYLNGYVTSFADAGTGPASWFEDAGVGRVHHYELTVHPWLWFLTRSANFRMFQSMTVPQVVKAVCDTYPFAQLSTKLLRPDYPVREYQCQYRETDFNFVLRLLEQEGIYFRFAHENGKHTMELFDSHSAHTARPGYASVDFIDLETGPDEEREHISDWHTTHEVQAGSYSLTDFDFENPRVSLLGTANKRAGHDLDGFAFFDFPGEYASVAAGAGYSRIRLEELQAQHEVINAAGSVRGIEPGAVFKLANHPHKEQNRDYLVTAANYNITNNQPGSDGAGGEFHCRFQLIDSRTQFRPARLTPKPVVQGPQTAMVVGPEGEEIHVDKLGRVKLMFHWDRYGKADENSSCWVRVSQPWSGKGWGALFIPRIGHEVIVEFLEGDPDRPIVVGRVSNGEAQTPWALPQEKTRSGFRTRTYKGGAGNFNELSFDDKQGAEEVFLQAERDQVARVKHDRIEDIGNQSHTTVRKDVFMEILGDAHRKVTGDHNSSAGGSVSLKAGQDWQAKAGARVAVDAAGEIHLKAGTKVVIEAGVSLSLKVGGNFITIDASGVYIKGTMVMINSGGAAGSGAGSAPIAPKPPKAARTEQGGKVDKPERPKAPEKYSPQAKAMHLAAACGTPLVRPDCEKPKAGSCCS
ncbi:MAG: type VI secretion system tip protein TssI/VgrG [Pseudomonadota bacterium]